MKADNDMDDNENLKEVVQEQIRVYMKTTAFSDRKITDTPTDALSVVNRKFVTANGPVASRPTTSVATIGQSYLATDIGAAGIPITKVTTGWVNGVGSIVAGNI